MAEFIATMVSEALEALEVAREMCIDAQQHTEATQNHAETLQELNPRLGFLRREWTTQSQYLQNIETGLRQSHDKLHNMAKDKIEQFETINTELFETLETLQKREVEPCLQPPRSNPSKVAKTNGLVSNSTDGLSQTNGTHVSPDARENSPILPAKPMTLYDLIDDEGLRAVWGQAKETIQKLERSNQAVDQAYREFQTLELDQFDSFEDLSLDQQHIQHQCAKQTDELDRMLGDLESISHHASQMQLVAEDPSLLTQENLAVLERDAEETDVIVNELREGLAFIQAIREEMEIRTHQYQLFYADLKRGLQRIFEFTPTITRLFSTLLRPSMADLREGEGTDLGSSSVGGGGGGTGAPLETRAELLVAECGNLRSWYTEFARAYDYLLVEIDRRRQVQHQHARMAAEFAHHLAALHATETQERDAFTQLFGQYLPIDMCAPLLAPAPSYQVETVVVPGDLPEITEVALQQAQRNITQGSAAIGSTQELERHISSLEL
ncbi:hypothetical protein H4R33_001137 [Dimargaris cristalligena]|uniref:Autophagy-related protein 17 n=1 Tax=Dimargaris cristalligena TaxID=215637 RepID=A0A4P9ZUU2_9FUNG|nr:hypothetical protein H4R33_001137 [Dimargaris cristalligena]RKP37366.1 autophagy-related protein 17 [Dimargaris cristalligena]|eukprot:RKP37366.1 autophagy-related protein 17 [Dimargaris cristalligena]